MLPLILWHSLSLFCWSLDLAICFLHFPLNPVLINFGGKNGFHPFSSSHISTLCHFFLWTMCNLVLPELQ
jgi:hypothetical protein